MYWKPPISPILRPTKFPKITKYRQIVIAGGTNVCTQIRENLRTSRVTMVLNAIYLWLSNIYLDPFLSNRLKNSCSKRLVLFRRLETLTPIRSNSIKTWLILFSADKVTSSDLSSNLRILTPSI